MSPADIAQLLKLPAGERVELAMVLWESLTDEQREAQFQLGPDERAELDRRWAEHTAQPQSATAWGDIRKKLLS